MNRLSHERLARSVLDKLLDSGQLRSVASDRAIAQLVHYLPPLIALEVPPEEEFADLLNPQRQAPTVEGVAEALTRIVAHEEREQWVAINADGLTVTVSLREQSKVLRATPIYEPELALEQAATSRVGQPRLRIAWDMAGEERATVFRQGQGLVSVTLGRRTPRLWVIEADPDSDDDGTVAYLVSDAAAHIAPADSANTAIERQAIADQLADVDGTHEAAHSVEPRTRIAVSHDVDLTLKPPWWRVWHRTVDLRIKVLGLARLGRPDLSFSSSNGEQRRWDRNREPVIELAADLFVHAEAEDRLAVENTSQLPAYVLWYEGAQLEVPPGARVTVQGSHVQGLLSPASTMWAASSGGFQAPPPRVLRVVGQVATPAPAPDREAVDPLFGFERRAATVFQDAAVVTHVQGAEVTVAVRSHVHGGLIAMLALDDCPGAKISYPESDRSSVAGPAHASTPMYRQVRDVIALGASGARLELVGAAQIVFAVPNFVRSLTADPGDAWLVGSFRFRVTSEGLDIERASPGDSHVEVNGVAYPGNARVGYDTSYRVRVGSGLYRIVREERPNGGSGLSDDVSAGGFDSRHG